MKPRLIRDGMYLMGAVDWDRRLFDSLIPLPDGTSYNAYLVKGSEKTALLDTVDPAKWDILRAQLHDVPNIDYVIAHHAEQDHSGSIPYVLDAYKNARVLCSDKCKGMLIDHLNIPAEKIQAVKDREKVSLGNKTMNFVYTPWVHWPETMVTWLEEDHILFSCDFFGSHLATTDLCVTDEARAYEGAKRYYAEIMMPFRKIIQKNLDKIEGLQFDCVAPSHGPLYKRPAFILDAYHEWISEKPKNEVVLPFISMHDSTRVMVEHLVGALAERGITVYRFDLAATDIGKLAIALVDAATIILGTPTVHLGPHPNVVYAAYLANALKPKARFASVIGSYGWGSKAVEQIAGMIPNLNVEVLSPVLCKGYPKEADFQALDALAATVEQKHKDLGLM